MSNTNGSYSQVRYIPNIDNLIFFHSNLRGAMVCGMDGSSGSSGASQTAHEQPVVLLDLLDCAELGGKSTNWSRAIVPDVHPIVLPQLRSIVLLPHSLTFRVGTGLGLAKGTDGCLAGRFGSHGGMEAWKKERKPSGGLKRVSTSMAIPIFWDPAIGPAMSTHGPSVALMVATTSILLHLQCRSSIFPLHWSSWDGPSRESSSMMKNP
jgi:hypothetical protein